MQSDLLLMCIALELPLLHFVLRPGKFVLGRSSRCTLVVNDSSVSRRHAEIIVSTGDVTVSDLDSHNGTYVDDVRIRTSAVRVGQRIRFGKIAFNLTNRTGTGVEHDSQERTDSVSLDNLDASPLAQADALSPAQSRVLDLLMDGLAQKEIASRLKLSQHTVHNHIRAIYEKLAVHSRPELLAKLRNDRRY